MIVHVVLFQPSENLQTADRARLLDEVRRAASTIPSVRRFRIGYRVKHGRAGYEKAMTEDYSFAAIIEFDDQGGLAEYLQHPSHEALGSHFTVSAQRAVAYDYEMEDVRIPEVPEKTD